MLAKQFPRKQRIYNKTGIPVPKLFHKMAKILPPKTKKTPPPQHEDVICKPCVID
jgi:hypothetical protein